jgi:hypothetical protein
VLPALRGSCIDHGGVNDVEKAGQGLFKGGSLINNRPKHLLNQANYGKLPAKPFAVNFQSCPALVRQALGPLGGIQPVTGEMCKAANGDLHDMPSEGEVKLFKEKGTCERRSESVTKRRNAGRRRYFPMTSAA